jgi:hypothetical protein
MSEDALYCVGLFRLQWFSVVRGLQVLALCLSVMGYGYGARSWKVWEGLGRWVGWMGDW